MACRKFNMNVNEAQIKIQRMGGWGGGKKQEIYLCKLLRESWAAHSARPLDARRLKVLVFMYSVPERVSSSVSAGSKASNTLSRLSAPR